MSVFKRGTGGKRTRKTEARRTRKHFDSNDIQSVRNKLGLNTGNIDKIKFELRKLRNKRKSTIKALGLTEEDFKKFGIILP